MVPKLDFMRTSEILELELTSLGIHSITEWARLYKSNHEREIGRIRIRYKDDPDSLARALKDDSERNAQLQSNFPRTVGDFVKMYPHSLVGGQAFGLGKDSVLKLKQKLTELGLKYSDWTALCPHYKLIDELNKELIEKLPVCLIFRPSINHVDFSRYLECPVDEVRRKTVKDFISVDLDENKQNSKFFKRRRGWFIATRQKLMAKGFDVRDGIFFNWNPETKLFNKAMSRLQKYEMDDETRRMFAGILVRERLEH